MDSEIEMHTISGYDLYSLSRRGDPCFSVYDSRQNEVFLYKEPASKTLRGNYRLSGSLHSTSSSGLEVSLLKNVIGNGGRMEVKSKSGSYTNPYHRAIAEVTTLSFFMSSKLKSTDLQLESERNKYVWSPVDVTLYETTSGKRVFAARAGEMDPASDTLSILVDPTRIPPHIAICFMFLKGL